MGTRGLYGFRKNGIDKTTYNHFDSYPDCLGKVMVEFCKATSWPELNNIFDRIIMVEEDSTPTPKQIHECIEYYDGGVSTGKPEEWYCLLRDAQGNPNVYKHGLKYMVDNQSFIKDSLFCEYAYIINLDTDCLEFWVGFQEKPDENNRYGTETHDNMDKYYPCKMVAEYPLDDIDRLSTQTLIDSMKLRAEEDEDNLDDDAEEERDVTSDDLKYISEEIADGFTSGTLDNGIEWRLEFDY